MPLQDIARSLGLSEYEVICRAYRNWQGGAPPPVLMGEVLAAYRAENWLPHWAQDYIVRASMGWRRVGMTG